MAGTPHEKPLWNFLLIMGSSLAVCGFAYQLVIRFHLRGEVLLADLNGEIYLAQILTVVVFIYALSLKSFRKFFAARPRLSRLSFVLWILAGVGWVPLLLLVGRLDDTLIDIARYGAFPIAVVESMACMLFERWKARGSHRA